MLRYKRASRSLQRTIIFVVLVLIVISALFYVQYDFAQKNPGGADSVPRWLGTHGWVYEGLNPYSSVISERGQMFISGRLSQGNEDKQHFVYPFYVVLYYLPVISLPFNLARTIWMIILEACILGLVYFSAQTFNWKPPVWLMGASFGMTVLMYNSVRTIILWQMAGLVAFLIILAVWALKERRDVLAGIALALATIKPQMVFLIIPLLLLWALKKRPRFILAFIVSMIGLGGFSFLAAPTWITDMLKQIREYPNYTAIPALLYIFTGFFPAALGKAIEGCLLIVFIGWLLWEWRRVIFEEQPFEFAVTLTLLVTNIIVTRSATTNYLMMLPGFFFIFAGMEKKYAGSSFARVFILQFAYFIGAWILFAFTLDNGAETWPMYFPMPLLLLGGLMWVQLCAERGVTKELS